MLPINNTRLRAPSGRLPPFNNAVDFSLLRTCNPLFAGDSYTSGQPDATYQWMLPLQATISAAFVAAGLPPPTYHNTGVGGSTTTDRLAAVAGDIALSPTDIFLEIGLNDCFNHGGIPIPPPTSQANITAYFAAVLQKLPACRFHVLSPLWFSSEQRPRGIGPNDAAVDDTGSAIADAVALCRLARYLNILTPIYTIDSPADNPSNLTHGVLTQADGTHPSKPLGQTVMSTRVADFLTFELS